MRLASLVLLGALGCSETAPPTEGGADLALPAADGGAPADLSAVPPPDAAPVPDLAPPPPPTLFTGYLGSVAKTGASQGNGVLNIGRELTVSPSGIVVHQLGIWDEGQKGLAHAHAVTLFSLDHSGAGAKATALAGGSVTVPAGAASLIDNGFRFAALPAPLTLAPGSYAIVGYGFDNADPYGDGGNLPQSGSGLSDAQFDPFAFVGDASPAFPSGGDGNAHTSVSLRYQTRRPFVRIMPFGDSITDGLQGSDAGYRKFLADGLDTAGIAFQYVGSASDNAGTLPADQRHHEGHSGYVIEAGSSGRSGLANSLDVWLGPGGATPDIILLMIGTNDVNINYDTANAGKRLDALLSRISNPKSGLRPHARVIVARIVRIVDATQDARVVLYNEQVSAVVAAHRAAGEPLQLVDMHAALDAADFADNLHPKDSGYKKMAQVWLDAIETP